MQKKTLLSVIALGGFIFLAFGSSGGTTNYDYSELEGADSESEAAEEARQRANKHG